MGASLFDAAQLTEMASISLDEFHAMMRAHGLQDDGLVLRLFRQLTEVSRGDRISAHELALVADAGGFAASKKHWVASSTSSPALSERP